MIRKVQVWVVAEKGDGVLQVLLLKTNAARGEFWQPVTGGVEPGEGFDQAALREVEEETGIRCSESALTRLSSFEFESARGWVHEQAFLVRVPSDTTGGAIKLDSREHTHYEWVLPEKALQQIHYESNRKVLHEWLTSSRDPITKEG